ncbi:hypothetical protein J2754_001601 [Halarchaeum solikamskense]|uniref:PaeR7I family type II restriction endonuclease n=1 Tax=Halarchaeum nitratireducens TaxID=489913 RepID=UPI001B3ABB9B|nr:PaeR7I family type II restriction endonuclease [Halarchaeum solikamskense]MBP2251280.1 hypothetical protein [Halarchaeum solikamskense]
MADIGNEVSDAVEWYWETLSDQADDQRDSDNTARGRRAQVLGGAQMDGFAGLIEDALVEAGLPRDDVLHDHDATLPGYFRATKRWDIAVVHEDEVLAAIELKSIASSFGNNLNNRVEEAVGNNIDIHEAYENGVIEQPKPPWVGYLILMADNEDSSSSVRVREPNLDIDDEYRDASYIDRARLLCERLVRQGVVDSTAFLTSGEGEGLDGGYEEPNPDLTFQRFLDDLVAHVETQIDNEQTKLDVDD